MPKILEEKDRTQTFKEVKIEIPKEEIDEVYFKLMREIQKDFVAPGFRKGKVPFSIIENKLGKTYVFQKVVEKALDESIREYISNLQRMVISINNIKLEAASYEKIVYSVALEVEPLVDIPDDIQVEIGKIEVDLEQEVEKRFSQIKDQFSSFQEVQREVKDGDRVDIYFEIKDANSGSLLAGGDNNVYQVMAIKEMLLPGIYEHLIGMKKEEEKEFEIDGPENIEQYKNRKLKVKVKVSNIFEKRLPNDEELLKLVNYKSMEELKKDIKNVVQQEKENLRKDLIFSRYIALIKEKVDFELPESLLKREKELQRNNFLEILKRQNRTLEDYLKSSNLSQEEFEKNMENIARENIKRAIIINNLLRKYGITLDNLEIEYYLKNDVETQRYVFELSQLKLGQEEINYRLSQFVIMKKLKDEISKKVKVVYVEQSSASK
ncbi:MAG: trigger factor [Candidatus Calescibacterium sp.]|nr:trigger factor [Candidatus Calescibacterium sp.]MCX7971803.1 trigger factor [bacterium]MDW8194917.1 trigger factor [Candidatus Calescibacterium sp.]